MVNLLKLKAKLVEKNKTKADFAKALGISVQAVNKKLNGKTKISTDDAAIICDFLQITNYAEKAEIFLNSTSQKRNKSA